MTEPSGDPQSPYPSWSDPTATPGGPQGAGEPGQPPTYPAEQPTQPAPMQLPSYPGTSEYPGMPGYPGTSGYPAGPGGFYTISEYGYGPAGYPAPGAPDPIVTWPGEGFGGWWRRLWATFGANFGTLFTIALLTSAVPSFLFTLATSGLQSQWLVVDRSVTPNTIQFDWGPGREFIAWFVAYWVLTIFLGALGWSAAIWRITKRAAGQEAPLGAALAYGARNCLRVGGVLLPCSLMIIGGLIACVLPGLYLAVATSLVVPVALYQRSAAISGTFRLVNSNFGAVLGRLLVTFLLLLGVTLLVSCLVNLGTGSTARVTTRYNAVDLFRDGVTGLVSAGVTAVVVVAVALVYAEMRARAWPTTVHELSAALDA